jgi:NAD(P)H-dependent FMN reductase
MKIQVIVASTRPGRVGERVGKWVLAAAKQQEGFEPELVDLADYEIPHFNEAVPPKYNPNRTPHDEVSRWLAKLDEADGYVIVTPEYNHGIPGILKDALDYTDSQLVKKPVALVGYGVVGAARSVEQAKLLAGFLGAAIVPDAVVLSSPAEMIGEDGSYKGDTSNPYGTDKQLDRVLADLAWWTQTLNAGRKVLQAA